MRASVLALLCVVGCATVVDEAEAVTNRRDALPTYFGPLDSKFGASIAVCPDAGFLVGMPGSSQVMSTNSVSGLPTFMSVDGGVGLAVACGRSPNGPVTGYAAGDDGVFQLLSDGSAQQLTTLAHTRVVALDFHGESLLMGAPPYVASSNGLALGGSADSGFGAAVLQIPGMVAVGDPESGAVTLATLDGGLVTQLYGLQPDTQFGAALAWGVVTPGAGPQLLVGAPGARRVYVFSVVMGVATNVGALPVDAPSDVAGFGAALSLEPLSVRDGGALNAVWVGAPDGDEVEQFVNGALVHQAHSTNPGERFGAALAAQRGTVAIGAPEYNAGNGALYVVDSTVGRPSELQDCTSGAGCSINCRVGACVAGVLCVEPVCTTGNCGCNPGYVCDQMAQQCVESPDAGVSDAGVSDAGVSDAGASDAGVSDAGEADAGETDAGVSDAGVSDAGETDAGETDAGTSTDAGVAATPDPARFTTSGCHAAPSVLAGWLTLLLARRRSAARSR